MKLTLEMTGVCAKRAVVVVNKTDPDGNPVITSLELTGGCDGQGKALNALLAGMPVAEAVLKLKDVKCGRRDTSCSAELVRALEVLFLNGGPHE